MKTARLRKGDIKAQAALLAAVLRNREIPARLAFGLKIDDANARLRFHMWVEAWVGSYWLPLDPTTGQANGVDCIKLVDSALEGENPYPPVLAVFKAMDSFTVRRVME